MNDTTLTDAVQQAQVADYSRYIVVFAIALTVVCVFLVLLVINQRQKINNMQKPKYGFLGKPLLAFIVVGFTLGSFGAIYYGVNQSTTINDTSASEKVELTIKAALQNSTTNDYILSIVPVINGKEWGGSAANSFDVYWTIENKSIVTEAELGLNLNNKGGIIKRLSKGTNKIKVTVFYNDKSYEQTKTLEI